MRHIEHPGPVDPVRVQYATANIRAVDVELPPGTLLLDGLAAAAHAHGVSSAVFSVQGGTLDPLAYYMPALSSTPEHVAYYSDRFEAPGEVRIDSGSITLGVRDGKPALHCHAIWIEADGTRRCGHLIPTESRVVSPLRLRAWMLDGAGFETQADPETNFTLLQVAAADAAPQGTGTRAFVVRVRPNQDLCHALETLCTELGIRRARICGGVGSLVGTAFEDGRVVEPFITEVFIRSGDIAPGPDGAPQARVDVGLVAHTGEIAEGRLQRGENPVLITFELVLEPLQ